METRREFRSQPGVDRRAVVALVLGALLFTAMMPGTSRGTEQADVSPCDKGCNVKAIFNWDVEDGWKTTFDRYYCYPNGKWLCPLTNKEPGLQE